jgi:quercetin dioxygenase-like cupin family protein
MINHTILEPLFTRNDQRGLFQEVIRDYTWNTIVVGQFHQNAELGHHYHRRTLLFFYLINGTAIAIIENVETKERNRLELHTGQGILFYPGESHVIRFKEESNFLVLKSLRYDPDHPDTYAYAVID